MIVEPTHPDDIVYESPRTIMKMMFGASSLLRSMTPEQLRSAQFPLDDPRRLDWDFIPKSDRIGLPLSAMSTYQRSLAQTLLASGLSMRGYTQALQIMSMENVLRELEVGQMGIGVGELRHPDRYFFAFFGRPGFEDTWGWRILGHHLSLSYTIINQRYLAMTPCNMGAQPIEVGVLSPLRRDDELGFNMLASLTDSQRATAIIHDVAPADYVTRQVPEVGNVEYPDYYDLGILYYQLSDFDREKLKFVRDEPAGIAASDLDEVQAAKLLELADWFLGRMPDDMARQHLNRLEADGLENLFFSWAGGQQPGTSHYYRLHARELLIEFDNAIGNGNHIHSVWRDLRNDLGHDLLADHYRREAHLGRHLTTRLVSSVPASPRPTHYPPPVL